MSPSRRRASGRRLLGKLAANCSFPTEEAIGQKRALNQMSARLSKLLISPLPFQPT
jgi:hypothetical protein